MFTAILKLLALVEFLLRRHATAAAARAESLLNHAEVARAQAQTYNDAAMAQVEAGEKAQRIAARVRSLAD